MVLFVSSASFFFAPFVCYGDYFAQFALTGQRLPRETNSSITLVTKDNKYHEGPYEVHFNRQQSLFGLETAGGYEGVIEGFVPISVFGTFSYIKNNVDSWIDIPPSSDASVVVIQNTDFSPSSSFISMIANVGIARKGESFSGKIFGGFGFSYYDFIRRKSFSSVFSLGVEASIPLTTNTEILLFSKRLFVRENSIDEVSPYLTDRRLPENMDGVYNVPSFKVDLFGLGIKFLF